MISSVRRFKTRVKTNSFYYLRCYAKTLTFLFWATLYVVVMKLTVFKPNVNTPSRDWDTAPDNYTKWLFQRPVKDEYLEPDNSQIKWDEPDNATTMELMDRAARVQKVCSDRGIAATSINSKEFFVDHVHNLVWCNIFKAASSSWLYKFNILGGYGEKYLAQAKQLPLVLARKKFHRPTQEEIRDAVNTPGVVSLLIVREPFVRLLSGYRDKLEKILPEFYKKMAREMMGNRTERTTKVHGKIKSLGPTFYEFVAYLIKKYKTSSFNVDEHWAPYYKFCSPCAVNFSVIAKVETLQRDSAYVIYQLGLGHVLDSTVRKVINKSKDGRNTTALLKHYFGQLDEKMLDGLLEIYGLDFEMFGYDADVYRKYVKK